MPLEVAIRYNTIQTYVYTQIKHGFACRPFYYSIFNFIGSVFVYIVNNTLLIVNSFKKYIYDTNTKVSRAFACVDNIQMEKIRYIRLLFDSVSVYKINDCFKTYLL